MIIKACDITESHERHVYEIRRGGNLGSDTFLCSGIPFESRRSLCRHDWMQQPSAPHHDIWKCRECGKHMFVEHKDVVEEPPAKQVYRGRSMLPLPRPRHV